MRVGLLADIHEDVERLRIALRRFECERVDQIVVLGDVAEMNQRLDETCRLLLDAGAIGVWGNHDFGICHVAGKVEKYAEPVRRFMPSLKPRLEFDGCLFTHVEPWLDTADLAELWYFDGIPDTPDKAARSFSAVSARLLFVGHFHRWFVATEDAISPWHGDETLHFIPGKRYLISVGAVCDGASAILDLQESTLSPFCDP
ncbi:MAG: metallophosphoesterase family protein [Planctomycetaceae bacterium]|nr:metallophosphoesterase family protein [Planctomycetaceae bacterium]